MSATRECFPYGVCDCGGQGNVLWRRNATSVTLWWECRICEKRWMPHYHDLACFTEAHEYVMEDVDEDGKVYRSRWWETTQDYDGPHGTPLTDEVLNGKRKFLKMPPITGGRFCRRMK